MRLKEENMQKRRETIIQNAIQLFCERGIESVKLTEISAKSKVGKATIYRYFGNKEKLVLEAFINLWDTIMSKVDEIVEGTPNYSLLTGYEQIKVWIEGFRHLYQVNEDFVLFSYEAKMYLLRHNVKLDKLQQDTLMQAFRAPCLAALDKGKKDGSIPVRENSENIFYAIWGSIRGYVVKIVVYDKLYEEDSPWESRYQVMENGILSALHAGWDPPGTGDRK